MSLIDDYKLYIDVTSHKTGRIFKIDASAISAIFNERHSDCIDGANAYLRYGDCDQDSTQISCIETPDEIEQQIEKKEKDLLGCTGLKKAFISVSGEGETPLKTMLAIDSLGSIHNINDSDNPCNSTVYFKAHGYRERNLDVIEMPEAIAQQIEEKQKHKARAIKRLMLSAVI